MVRSRPSRIRRGRERVRRAQQALAQSGFDALFLATGTNLCFLSGYPSVELTLARPFYLVLPADGEPILLVHAGREAEARRYAWVDDVRTYRRLSVAPLGELDQAFRDRAVRGGRIGAELGREQRLGMPVLEFERIQQELAPARFDDAADVLWDLRMYKTDDDIAAIRRACRITAAAYGETFKSTRADELDGQVAARLSAAMVAHGGHDPWVLVASGPGNYALATGAPLGRRLALGDMLWFDAGCSVQGFWSDFSRAGVVGRPSAEQRDAQRLIAELTATGVAMVRSGVPVAEIASVVDEGVRDVGLPVEVATSESAGRVGHGIGYDITEPPHVSVDDPTILAPGMVITIEPGVATSFGLFHAEDVVAVTDKGPDVLSHSRRNLRSIALGDRHRR
jgi:Xaa-Pro aminopeptidase